MNPREILRRPRRASMGALLLCAAFGLGAFCWPLLVSPSSVLAPDTATGTATSAGGAPWLFAALLPLVLAVALAEVGAGGLDAKTVAMLGVLSAIGAAIRPLGGGTGGVETVFFLLVLAGRVFGPAFGFVLGNTMLLTSALLTGGVGPWLPYQMLAAAWFGLGAGLLPRLRGWWEVALLTAYGMVASLLYGLLMNLSFWPFGPARNTSLGFVAGEPALENLRRLVIFSLATSLGWDVGRAITTAVLLLVAGPLVLRVLRRAARRAAFVSA